MSNPVNLLDVYAFLNHFPQRRHVSANEVSKDRQSLAGGGSPQVCDVFRAKRNSVINLCISSESADSKTQ
jgi:hypothetical protein